MGGIQGTIRTVITVKLVRLKSMDDPTCIVQAWCCIMQNLDPSHYYTHPAQRFSTKPKSWLPYSVP